jgi:hypothetical protein
MTDKIKSKVILERGFVEDNAATDEYVDPGRRAEQGKQKKYVVTMDVSEINAKGNKLRPRTASFTNNPFDTYEEAIQACADYAKLKYPNDKIQMTAGSKGKEDGFVLIESKRKPTETDATMYNIKLYVEYTNYHHGSGSTADRTDGTSGQTANGQFIVDVYLADDPLRISNQMNYGTEQMAISGIKQYVSSYQKGTLYRGSSAVKLNDTGSAIVVKDKNGRARALYALRNSTYPAVAPFRGSTNQEKNIRK